MFRIQAGLMFGLEDANLNSQEDLDWYEMMKEKADEATSTEIQSRGADLNKALVAYRDNLPGDDVDQKNYEASWSDPGLELDVLNVKTVQGNLGHATASFTLDVYGHISQKMRQQSADRMERFIQSFSS